MLDFDELAFKLAQATLRAWNLDAGFGDNYFKSNDGKKVVRKVRDGLGNLMNKEEKDKNE